MRISGAYPSNYLKATDLQGRNVTVSIERVVMEDIARGEQKPVLYFAGKEKGIVLNKTNANTIADAYGDETDQWAGKSLVLFEALVDYQGRSVPAIRMRSPQPKDEPRQTPPPPDPARQGPADDLDSDVPF